MDNKYLENVIKEIKPFLDENGFVSDSIGSFKNDKKSVKVSYSDERQSFVLLMADVLEDGQIGEYSEASAWLFDDTQNEKDALSVGIDFTETIREKMGIKNKAVNRAVDLPTASKGSALNISGFTKKVLDVYPQFKDTYKEYVQKYGNFLYLNFFGTYLVPQIKSELTQNTKKSVKKVLDLLENGYVTGDKETVNAIVAVLAAACYKDETVTANANEMLKDNTHFKSALNAFIPVLSSKKKLKEVLVK